MIKDTIQRIVNTTNMRSISMNMINQAAANDNVVDQLDYYNWCSTPLMLITCILNNIQTPPMCNCGEPLKWNFSKRSFSKYCSSKCKWEDNKLIQYKKQQTNLQKYGTSNFLASELGKTKRIATCILKYGVDSYTKTDEYKQRVVSGNIKRNIDYHKISNALKKRKYDSLLTNPQITPLFTFNEYQGSASYAIEYDWMCNTCNTKFKHWLNNGYPVICPACHKMTNGEEFINSILAKSKLEVNYRDRCTIPGIELDFYIPSKRIAIEFNGLYWHCEQHVNRSYHINKHMLCAQHNIQLISVFDDEIRNTPNIVRMRLKHILNNTTYRVYARKCEIRQVNTEFKTKFLKKYHIQGDVTSQYNYGLYSNNKCVAIMCLGKRKILDKSTNQFELLRYATISSFTVVGGAGKLLQYFIMQHTPDNIVSYCDRRWSTGNLYKQLGFKLLKTTPPNYWYTKTFTERLNRVKFQKHKLKSILPIYDDKLSESENMKANKFFKIWDCGSLKFILSVKHPVAT